MANTYGESGITYGFAGGTYGDWGAGGAVAIPPADSGGGVFRPAGVEPRPNLRRYDDDDVLLLI